MYSHVFIYTISIPQKKELMSTTKCASTLLTNMKAHLKQASSRSSDMFSLPMSENVYRINNNRLEWRKLRNTDIPRELGPLSTAAIDGLPTDFCMKVSL